MNMRKIAATIALMPTMAAAGLDRAGNVLREDDGGGSGSLGAGPILLMLAGMGASTYVLYKVLEKRTGYSSEANFNIAWLVVLFGSALLMTLMK